MREIKFRAWDKKKKVMFPVHELKFDKHDLSLDFIQGYTGYDRDGWTVEGNGIMRYANAPRYELMQYTGLKDKNRKEIYEGDIVVAWSEGCSGKFEVRWRQESVPQWILYQAWQSQKFWNLHGSKHEDGHYYDMVEVIGDIYQNPELLEGEHA